MHRREEEEEEETEEEEESLFKAEALNEGVLLMRHTSRRFGFRV